MNSSTFSGQTVTLPRVLALLLLTTTATLIVAPYFGGNVDFPTLWLRLFIVALVMMIAFSVTDATWRAAAQPRFSMLTTQLIAVTVAAFIGTLASGLLIGRTLTQMFTVEPMLLGIVVFTTVAIGIGTVTAMVLVYRERAARADVDVVRASSRQHELEKQVLEARLKLMQAQIEPHFLFNTLASVQQLAEGKAPEAAELTRELIAFLRAGLAGLRDDTTTLEREFAMAAAFLAIMKTRMGDRLAYDLHLPDPLRNRAIPPAMLISLVENAINHGLEPSTSGGQLWISAREVLDENKTTLVIEVRDTGLGLGAGNGATMGGGVGLSNVRERLEAIYGEHARLQIEENSPHGVVAMIEITEGKPVQSDTNPMADSCGSVT